MRTHFVIYQYFCANVTQLSELLLRILFVYKEEALRYFREALDIYPINTDVIGIYGDYYEYSDYDLSMKFYELAIRLNSIRKKDYFQLANFYKWKGQYDKAERCYARWEYIKQRAGIED